MEPPPNDERLYTIDVEGLEAKGRSFLFLTQQRFCPSCRARMEEVVERRTTVVDPRSGEKTVAQVTQRYGDAPLQVIEECCSRKADYLLRERPLLEAIFRVFLAASNIPLSPEEVAARLTLAGYGLGHDLSDRAVRRLLDAGWYYHIRPAPVSEEKPEP